MNIPATAISPARIVILTVLGFMTLFALSIAFSTTALASCTAGGNTMNCGVGGSGDGGTEAYDPPNKCTSSCNPPKKDTPGKKPTPAPPAAEFESEYFVTRTTVVYNYDSTIINGGAAYNRVRQSCPASKGYAGARIDIIKYHPALGSNVAVGKKTQYQNATCINYKETSKSYSCVVDLRAVIAYNPVVKNPQVSAVKKTSSTKAPWGKSNKKVADAKKCNSKTVLSSEISTIPFGRYSFDGTVRKQNVKIEGKINPISNKKVEKLTIGKVYSQVSNYKGERTCKGWKNSWATSPTERNFSLPCDPPPASCTDDTCKDTAYYNKKHLMCAPVGKDADVSINGKADANVSVFRDGEANKVVFRRYAPVISGKTKITKSKLVSSIIYKGGTPSKKSGSDLFVLSRTAKGSNVLKNNTWKTDSSAAARTYYARGMWASDSGQPVRLQPKWVYDVTYTITENVTTSARINDAGKVVHTVKKKVNNVKTKLECTGRQATLNFVRGTTSN